MKTPIPLLVLVIVLALTVTACAVESPGSDEGSLPPDEGVSTPPSDDPAGLRLANGWYDQADGTVLALGTLEWVDLEGGFYALTGSPEGDGNIAVIANADEFSSELEALVGKTVQVTGTPYEGASIRMAGPEIVITSVEEISDTSGAAE